MEKLSDSVEPLWDQPFFDKLYFIDIRKELSNMQKRYFIYATLYKLGFLPHFLLKILQFIGHSGYFCCSIEIFKC